MSDALYDKNRRPIEIGDVIKVFHFVGARNKRHYMYKQVIGFFHPEKGTGTYLKFSHLNMDDSIKGYYLERRDDRVLEHCEIVQSIDCRFEDRPRKEANPHA